MGYPPLGSPVDMLVRSICLETNSAENGLTLKMWRARLETRWRPLLCTRQTTCFIFLENTLSTHIRLSTQLAIRLVAHLTVSSGILQPQSTCRMFRYEPRDKSAPMDLDQPEVQHRLAQFAIPEPEEGPARKRESHRFRAESRGLCGRTLSGNLQLKAHLTCRHAQRHHFAQPSVRTAHVSPTTTLRHQHPLHLPLAFQNAGCRAERSVPLVQALRSARVYRRDAGVSRDERRRKSWLARAGGRGDAKWRYAAQGAFCRGQGLTDSEACGGRNR